MILEFTQAVAFDYSADVTDFMEITISGKRGSDYEYTWSAPDWKAGKYHKQVFIELSITSSLDGDEYISLSLNTYFLKDSNGYIMIARNSSSGEEFQPLTQVLDEQDYLSAAEKAAADGSGGGVIATLLITMAFNAIIAILSTGSLEIMWTLLNTVQLLDYIPILKLHFPANLT